MSNPHEQYRELVDLFQAAFRQRRLMEPWKQDQAFIQKSERQIWYATDSDVVVLYMRPDKQSIKLDHREGYAEVFPADIDEEENASTVALGHALAKFIFFHASGSLPIIIFPPTREELRRIYRAVSRGAGQGLERIPEQLKHLKDICSQLRDIAGDSNQLRERLAQEAPDINEVLCGLGATGELARLSYLMSQKRLANPEDLASHKDGSQWKYPAAAFAEPKNLREKIELAEIREQWFKLLTQEYHQRPGKADGGIDQVELNNLANDADLLARIQWINGRLPREQRLVLLTGAPTLFRLANNPIQHWRSPESGKTFADLYLRHPRAYLAEPEVLFPSRRDALVHKEANKTQFLEWLDTFLSHSDSDKLAESARTALEIQPNLLRDFKARWGEYQRSVLLAHPFSDLALNIQRDNSSHNQFRELFTTAQDLDQLRQGIHDLVDQQIEKNWHACFSMATLAGYNLLFQRVKGSGIPTRNPPPIYFTTLKKARQFIVQLPFFRMILQARETNQDLNSDQFQHELDVLRDGEDQTGYTYFLGFAQLFAMEGVWGVANIQAKRAYDIAMRSTIGNISGREAAYFRAVATRHTAEKISDLRCVRQHIDDARKLLAQDQDPGRPPEPTTTTGLRFDAEDLAVYVTACLFRIFLHDEIPPDLYVPLEEIEARLARLANSLQTDYPTEDEWVLRHVERNLVTNLLMVALLRYKENPSSVSPEKYQSWVQRLEENIAKRKDIKETFLVKAILLATRWWSAKDKGSRRKLESLLPDYIIKDRFRSVLPYDQARYRFLRDLVNN